MHSVDHMDDYKEFSVEQKDWKAPILNEDYTLWYEGVEYTVRVKWEEYKDVELIAIFEGNRNIIEENKVVFAVVNTLLNTEYFGDPLMRLNSLAPCMLEDKGVITEKKQ